MDLDDWFRANPTDERIKELMRIRVPRRLRTPNHINRIRDKITQEIVKSIVSSIEPAFVYDRIRGCTGDFWYKNHHIEVSWTVYYAKEDIYTPAITIEIDRENFVSLGFTLIDFSRFREILNLACAMFGDRESLPITDKNALMW